MEIKRTMTFTYNPLAQILFLLLNLGHLPEPFLLNTQWLETMLKLTQIMIIVEEQVEVQVEVQVEE